MHPIRRALIWLALASPVSKVTLYCLDMAVRHWQSTAAKRGAAAHLNPAARV